MFRSLSFISQSMVFSVLCSFLLVYFQHTVPVLQPIVFVLFFSYFLINGDRRNCSFRDNFTVLVLFRYPTCLQYQSIPVSLKLSTEYRVYSNEYCTVQYCTSTVRSIYSTPTPGSSLCRPITKATFFFISTSTSQFEFTHFFPHLPFTQLTQSLAVSLFLRRSRSALLAKENEARYWNFLAFVLSCE